MYFVLSTLKGRRRQHLSSGARAGHEDIRLDTHGDRATGRGGGEQTLKFNLYSFQELISEIDQDGNGSIREGSIKFLFISNDL